MPILVPHYTSGCCEHRPHTAPAVLPPTTAQAQTEALNNAKNDRKPDRPDSQKKPNFCINFQGNPVPRLNLAAQLLPRSM